MSNLCGKDLLSCRLVSTFLKTQTDKVIGYKNQDEDDPNLAWNPRHVTQLKCKAKENFLVHVAPGTTVVKTQKQVKRFLKFALQSSATCSSSNPFKNGALIYRAASRMRVSLSLLCRNRNRDVFVVFDRPVDGLTQLLSIYGHHLTSFVFDCKNQSFYQFLTAQDLSKILTHLPNLKFLGINAPVKFGLDPPSHQLEREEEMEEAKTKLPPLPNLEAISFGSATTVYCCRGYGDGILAWEQLIGVYGNQLKSLTIGGSGTVSELLESYTRIFSGNEPDPQKRITFERLENLKVFDSASPFDLLQSICQCPAQEWHLKRLSLLLRRCHCPHSRNFACPLASWSKSIPNIIMVLMSKFASSLEELYVFSEERGMDLLHWIHPCKYEWDSEKEEEHRKFMERAATPCKVLRKISLPANRYGTKVFVGILERCVALEEFCLLTTGNKLTKQQARSPECENWVRDLWTRWPTLQKVVVIKEEREDQQILYKCTRS